eukprot:6602472-Alexandrium_andersonii.AAC.1
MQLVLIARPAQQRAAPSLLRGRPRPVAVGSRGAGRRCSARGPARAARAQRSGCRSGNSCGE